MLPHWNQNTLTVDGIKIHYTRTGDGSKPPLVLAHGFSDNGLCWLPVARDLERDYDIILPDARAHGLSARVQPGEQMDHPGDLLKLIQALELNHPIVGGHSMGANTAAQLGARYPEVPSALVLEDPPWFQPTAPKPVKKEEEPPARENPFLAWISGLQGKTVEEVIESGRANNPNWPEVEWLPWGESKLQLDTNIFKTERMWDTFENWHTVVRALRAPTLLITAVHKRGAIVTRAAAQQAEELSPYIRTVYIRGAGHSIRRENYRAYMNEVRGFLDSLRTAKAEDNHPILGS